jgi:hypothetical protein
MMPDYRDKSVLVVDHGLFVSLAELLVQHFGKVGYFCDWQSACPDGQDLILGSGLDGVDRVKYLWNEIDQYDLFVFPDCYNGDLQEYLRRQGKRVWGGGLRSDLELARWKTNQLLAKVGLPNNEAVQLTGMDELRAYLQEHKDVFVKISALRGLGETFHSQDYALVKGRLDDLEGRYGAMMEAVPFIVEKSIPDAKELGYDGYCIDGEFPNSAWIGAEEKAKAYVAKLLDYDELPDEVKEVNTKLSYEMDGYRQFFSTELRNEFLIDTTCRHASPAGEVICQAMTNLPDVLYQGAEGHLVHGEWSAKYAAQIIFCSEWAKDHVICLEFPEEIRPWVKLYDHCRINGKDYVVPQPDKMKQLGSVIAFGGTADEACKIATERMKKIKGYDLESETDSLAKAAKTLEETT